MDVFSVPTPNLVCPRRDSLSPVFLTQLLLSLYSPFRQFDLEQSVPYDLFAFILWVFFFSKLNSSFHMQTFIAAHFPLGTVATIFS